jgi:hypothetical protein
MQTIVRKYNSDLARPGAAPSLWRGFLCPLVPEANILARYIILLFWIAAKKHSYPERLDRWKIRDYSYATGGRTMAFQESHSRTVKGKQ